MPAPTEAYRWLRVDKRLVVVNGDEAIIDLFGLRDLLVRQLTEDQIQELLARLDGTIVADGPFADGPGEELTLCLDDREAARGYVRDPFTGGWKPTPETIR